MTAQIINQGDIYWIAPKEDQRHEFGTHPHPYVVVQENLSNHSRVHSVIVCMLTTNIKKASLPGNVRLDVGEGSLDKPSIVAVSQISAVAKDDLGEYIGTLSQSRIEQILAGLP